jgi:hypothetical protein
MIDKTENKYNLSAMSRIGSITTESEVNLCILAVITNDEIPLIRQEKRSENSLSQTKTNENTLALLNFGETCP